MSRVIALIILGVFSVILSGCGRVDVNFHTDIAPSGAIIQTVTAQGHGAIGGLIANNYDPAKLKAEGWQSTIDRAGDAVTLTAKKMFEKEARLLLLSTAGSESTMGGVRDAKLDIKNYVVLKEYVFEATVVGTPTNKVQSGTSDDFAKLGETIAQSMFTMSWTITAPGEIVATNADTTKGNAAIWNFPLSSLNKDRHMMLHTRFVDWLTIALVFGVMLLLVISITVIAAITKRRGGRQLMEAPAKPPPPPPT